MSFYCRGDEFLRNKLLNYFCRTWKQNKTIIKKLWGIEESHANGVFDSSVKILCLGGICAGAFRRFLAAVEGTLDKAESFTP